MSKIRPDSRANAIGQLQDVLKEALELSLAAQLCARGNDVSKARCLAKASDSPEYKRLISPDGSSGYLAFQWISESLLSVSTHVAQIDLRSFWLLVEAGKDTTNVYETHLQAALGPLDDGLSAVRKNLDELFAEYPKNKIGVEALDMLKQLGESVNVIHDSIEKLLLLSPPAKAPIKYRLTWRVVAAVFLVALLTLPVFYWQKNGGTAASTSAVANKVRSDVEAVQIAAEEAPNTLPKLIFKDIVPAASNLLLLLGALLGIFRAFTGDSRSDSKKMIEELTGAAERLRKIKAG